MYNNKMRLPVAALAGASLAQSFTPNPSCSASLTSIRDAAPTMAPALSPYLYDILSSRVLTVSGAVTTLPPDTLADPEGFVELLCDAVPEIPSSVLPDFQSWGQALLSYGSVHISEYDNFVTECVTTGAAAATLTSYLNNLLTGTGGFCQPTATATPGSASNGTVSATPAPTSSGSNSTTTGYPTSIVTGAAAKPTGVLIGAAAVGGLLGAAILL
ncbi:hypothetical protein F5Y03DRAFT_405240 [Xylaria venustula]|nr:hypothetical protein F5Y03DRAFT_405240 [Xylaria venustula]